MTAPRSSESKAAAWLREQLRTLAERHNGRSDPEHGVNELDIDDAVSTWLEQRGINEEAARLTLLRVLEGNDWLRPGAIGSAVSRRILGARATTAIGEVWVRWAQLDIGARAVEANPPAAAKLRAELEARREAALRSGNAEDLVTWAKTQVPWLGRQLGDEPIPEVENKRYALAPDEKAAAIAKRIIRGSCA